MIELPNPFDPNSGTIKSTAVEPAPPIPSLIPTSDAVAKPFPRGFDPERFLADVESPPTSDLQTDQMSEDEIVQIVEALVRLAARGP